MKLHPALVKAVIDTLQKIFVDGWHADKAVEQVLKQSTRWGSRDRRFIAENIYEMVRWWRYISLSIGKEHPTELDYYELFAAWQILKGLELPEWNEFQKVNKEQVIANSQQLKSIRKYRESIPDWLDELGSSELGEKTWENEISELNKPAKVVLRVNTLKTNVLSLQKKLKEKGIETETLPNYPDALILSKRQGLIQLEEYKQGLFEVQDASSQLVAPFLKLEQGMTVIDACAGAGGKSLHIASMMANTGTIISLDIEKKKLLELKKRADRAGAKQIVTQLVDPGTIYNLHNSADRLLLDVPCSGLGILRRNPDAKWKLTAEFIDEVKKTQQNILNEYSKMVKPGGILVYATCSILPGENQNQVEEFLIKNKSSFEIMEDRKVLPSEGFDGFYMASIKRKN